MSDISVKVELVTLKRGPRQEVSREIEVRAETPCGSRGLVYLDAGATVLESHKDEAIARAKRCRDQLQELGLTAHEARGMAVLGDGVQPPAVTQILMDAARNV